MPSLTPYFGQPIKAIYLTMSAGYPYSQGQWYATFRSDNLQLIADESNPQVWISSGGATYPSAAGHWVKAPYYTRWGPNVYHTTDQQIRMGGASSVAGGPLLAPASGGDRYLPFSAANTGNGPPDTGHLYIYDGIANATTDIFLFPMIPAGAGWNTSAIGAPPFSVAPDGRYLYTCMIWSAVPPPSTAYGPPPGVAGVILEVDLQTQVVTRSWNFGPPWGGSGGYPSGRAASVDHIKAGPSMVSMHVSVDAFGSDWVPVLYTIDRASGTLAQWTTNMPPSSPTNPLVQYGDSWSHPGISSGDARYLVVGDWNVPLYSSTATILYHIYDMVNQTNVTASFSIANANLTPGNAWFGASNTQFSVQYCYGGIDYYPNQIPTNQQVDIRRCSDGAVVSSGPGMPWSDTFQYILSNGNVLGGWFSPTTGPVGSYSTVTLGIRDPSNNIVSSYTGPYYPGTSYEQPFWLADDESYVLLAINEVGTFDASSERKAYFPYGGGEMRASVIKLAIPSFAFMGQSDYIYSPHSGGGFGGTAMPGCTEVFEMLNAPVIFTAPAQRQYPRDDAIALGGPRQKVSRGNPKTHQFSTRQGYKGTHY
jgi:hypothetical protein